MVAALTFFKNLASDIADVAPLPSVSERCLAKMASIVSRVGGVVLMGSFAHCAVLAASSDALSLIPLHVICLSSQGILAHELIQVGNNIRRLVEESENVFSSMKLIYKYASDKFGDSHYLLADLTQGTAASWLYRKICVQAPIKEA